jgi:hypothetical protein
VEASGAGCQEEGLLFPDAAVARGQGVTPRCGQTAGLIIAAPGQLTASHVTPVLLSHLYLTSMTPPAVHCCSAVVFQPHTDFQPDGGPPVGPSALPISEDYEVYTDKVSPRAGLLLHVL